MEFFFVHFFFFFPFSFSPISTWLGCEFSNSELFHIFEHWFINMSYRRRRVHDVWCIWYAFLHLYMYILKLDICMCVRVCVWERELSTAIPIVPPRRTHLPVEMSATLWSHWAWCRRPDVPGTINYYPIIINGHTQYIILFRCVIVNWYITECIRWRDWVVNACRLRPYAQQ